MFKTYELNKEDFNTLMDCSKNTSDSNQDSNVNDDGNSNNGGDVL
jgi:hypothetical protein